MHIITEIVTMKILDGISNNDFVNIVDGLGKKIIIQNNRASSIQNYLFIKSLYSFIMLLASF